MFNLNSYYMTNYTYISHFGGNLQRFIQIFYLYIYIYLKLSWVPVIWYDMLKIPINNIKKEFVFRYNEICVPYYIFIKMQ